MLQVETELLDIRAEGSMDLAVKDLGRISGAVMDGSSAMKVRRRDCP